MAQQAISNVGDTCTAAADAAGVCVSNAHCWILDNPDGAVSTQLCHCDPAYTACGNNCVLLGTSSTDCGFCGNSCGGGSCVNGACGGSLPDASWTPHLGSIDEVSAYDASSHASWAGEAAEEYSLNTGIMFSRANYQDDTGVGVDRGKWNSTDAGTTTWGTDFRDLPVDAGWQAGQDPSVATSGWSGDEYFGSILINIADEEAGSMPYHCVGVTAATATSFPSWEVASTPNAMVCINSVGSIWDAPKINYDQAGTTLWVAASDPAAGKRHVYKKDSCKGAIGGANCAVPFEEAVPPSAAAGEIVVANRCAPGAFWAERTGTDNSTVKLTQIMSDHTTRTCTVSSSEAIKPNTKCTNEDGSAGGNCPTGDLPEQVCKCGGTTSDCTYDVTKQSCWRIWHQPQIALKAEANHCYVYMAWDKSTDLSAGVSRTAARLHRIDVQDGITDGAACPTHTDDVDLTWFAPSFASNIQVSKTSTNCAWSFYFDDTEDGCTVKSTTAWSIRSSTSAPTK